MVRTVEVSLIRGSELEDNDEVGCMNCEVIKLYQILLVEAAKDRHNQVETKY